MTPHCVGKFKPVFGELYWPSSWSQLFLLRHVFFGFSPDELLVVPRVFVYLLHVLKFLIW